MRSNRRRVGPFRQQFEATDDDVAEKENNSIQQLRQKLQQPTNNYYLQLAEIIAKRQHNEPVNIQKIQQEEKETEERSTKKSKLENSASSSTSSALTIHSVSLLNSVFFDVGRAPLSFFLSDITLLPIDITAIISDYCDVHDVCACVERDSFHENRSLNEFTAMPLTDVNVQLGSVAPQIKPTKKSQAEFITEKIISSPPRCIYYHFRWVDQAWGNRKGELFLSLRRNSKSIARYNLGGGIAEHCWMYVSGRIGEEQEVIQRAERGDVYVVENLSGGGGGHELFVTDFRMEFGGDGSNVHAFAANINHLPAISEWIPPLKRWLQERTPQPPLNAADSASSSSSSSSSRSKEEDDEESFADCPLQ